MKIAVKDGKLSLRSLYKLVVAGWIAAFGAFFSIIFILLLLISILTGEMMVNGEVVQGRGQILVQMLPMLVLFPIIIVMQGFMIGAFILGGMA